LNGIFVVLKGCKIVDGSTFLIRSAIMQNVLRLRSMLLHANNTAKLKDCIQFLGKWF